MTFRYPSFCRIVLGSLPSVKVNQVRETRTGLLGFACVQRGRIPSVGGWTPFHIHLLFSSPSFLPSASSVTKQFCVSSMGLGGSSSHPLSPFCRMLLHCNKITFPSPPVATFRFLGTTSQFRWGPVMTYM